MLNLFGILLDDAATTTEATTQPASWTSYIGTIVMIVAMVAIFYFLLYRPQKKQEKETAKMRNTLEVGDEVTTIGGIIGEVVSIKEDTVTIETGKDRSKIRIHRSAIKSIDFKAGDTGSEE